MVSARQNTKMYYITIPTTQYTNLPQKCTAATYSDSSYKHKHLTGSFKLTVILKNDTYTKSVLLTISVESIVQPYGPDAKHHYCYKNTDI